MLKNKIFTNEEACKGCNKCVLKCPTNANNATFENLKNKVYVNGNRCVNCGECISICDHLAREYEDDTEQFFSDLAKGAKISIIVAPAARTNFPNITNLFGYLKKQGVNLIYDVSYGADICTWGYMKMIKEKNLKTVISQPCPVVVNYLEHFQPTLIPYLSPVQSPAICTAIYLKKYKNNRDKIAFLSPCIAKSCEFEDPLVGGHIQYNVTYQKLIDYMNKNHVNLNQYPATKFDNIDGSVGFTFSRPGGLKENVAFYLGEDVWVTQVEGMEHVVEYFKEYESNIKKNRPVPLLVDVLNCIHGCNIGTGTAKTLTRDEIDYKTNTSKKKVDKETAKELLTYFDKELNVTDFLRSYEDKSKDIIKFDSKNIDAIFEKLGKTTEEQRKVNCFCCGYGTCEEFALAIANGNNHYDNCVHYLESSFAKRLLDFDECFRLLSTKLENTNNKLGEFRDSSKKLQDISMQTKIISINASIASAHAGQAGRAFEVVAAEIKRLAEMSTDLIRKNSGDTSDLINEVKDIDKYLENIKTELHQSMRNV